MYLSQIAVRHQKASSAGMFISRRAAIGACTQLIFTRMAVRIMFISSRTVIGAWIYSGQQGYQIYGFCLMNYEYDEYDDDEEEDEDKTCAWQYPSTGLSTL